MRLDEPIEKSGFFWFPEDPDVRVPGDLHISESGEVSLKVHIQDMSPSWNRVLNEHMSGEGSALDRILGTAAGQGLITLDDCLVTNFSSSGFYHYEFTMLPQLTLIGCHYEAGEEVTFTEFNFSVEGIDEWLAVSGITVRHEFEDLRTSVEIRALEEIHVGLPDGMGLKFKFRVTFPSPTMRITEAQVTQKAFVSLVSSEPRPLEYFASMAKKLRNFLRLAIGQPISMDSVTGYSPELVRTDGNGGEYKVPIQLHYRENGSSEKKQETSGLRMPFLYTDIESQIEEILANWLHSYKVFGPALDGYFTAMANTSQYLEDEFLQLARGIETLHRRSSTDTVMPKEEFEELVAHLVASSPNDSGRWLKTRLRYANELSLRRRLRLMIEPYERFFGDRKQQKAFVDKVVITRNYLTHYDTSLENQAAAGGELWQLTRKLEVLLQLHMLQSIGFDAWQVDRSLHTHSNLRRLLRAADLVVP